jgi:hypothetical protein
MNEVSIYRLTNSEDWAEFLKLADSVLQKSVSEALLMPKEQVNDALDVARGGAKFLERLKAEVSAVSARIRPESAVSKFLPENTPIEIL